MRAEVLPSGVVALSPSPLWRIAAKGIACFTNPLVGRDHGGRGLGALAVLGFAHATALRPTWNRYVGLVCLGGCGCSSESAASSPSRSSTKGATPSSCAGSFSTGQSGRDGIRNVLPRPSCGLATRPAVPQPNKSKSRVVVFYMIQGRMGWFVNFYAVASDDSVGRPSVSVTQ